VKSSARSNLYNHQKQIATTAALLAACFLLGSIFAPEAVGITFLQYTGGFLLGYVALHPDYSTFHLK
jgi:hypothetical protein